MAGNSMLVRQARPMFLFALWLTALPLLPAKLPALVSAIPLFALAVCTSLLPFADPVAVAHEVTPTASACSHRLPSSSTGQTLTCTNSSIAAIIRCNRPYAGATHAIVTRGVSEQTAFRELEQAAFRQLKHTASLKGLLNPLKVRGELTVRSASPRPLRQ